MKPFFSFFWNTQDTPVAGGELDVLIVIRWHSSTRRGFDLEGDQSLHLKGSRNLGQHSRKIRRNMGPHIRMPSVTLEEKFR